jgi:class 3 adenylate cyclase
MLYYHKAIATLRKSADSVALASAISNAGDEFLNRKMYDSASIYFKESGLIFEKSNYLIGKAYSLGNIGMVYANVGQSNLAEKNINEAIRILEELEDYYPICVYLISMCDIYLERGDNPTAMLYVKRSLRLAQQYGLKDQISAANLKLSELYEKAGNLGESFNYYKNHIVYRDSVNNIQSVQQMADLRTDYEVSQKQTEVDLLSQQKKNQQLVLIATVITSILIFLLAIGLYRRYNFIRETNVIIEEEKNRSESLLLNILPEETATELKQSGSVQAKKFESVTVLFSDFKGFTILAEQVEPEQLVKSIDFYFKEFDKITTKYSLEKIKTIGDSYMCAGGLPVVNKTHARNVIQAAKEMIDFVRREFEAQDDLIHFEARIGVHTGPVVAGIVGTKKWQYDIWGDTVNIASRMESMSESGMINLSETTYHYIKDEFPCEYRGEIDMKNHGAMKMYFLA